MPFPNTLQFSTTLRTNRGSQIGTTISTGGTMTFHTGSPPGVGNSATGTLLSTLTAVAYSESLGTCTITATADSSAAASGTPGYGRLLSSGATAFVEGTAGVGSGGTFNTVTLSGSAIATVPVNSGGSGYPVSASLPVILTGGSPTIPAVVIATTNSSGVITGTTITYAGTGYGSAPTATIAPPFDFTFSSTISLGGTVTLSSGSIVEGNA
jgi:hypothetical protein